jgi:hypothetical protein
MAIINKKLTGSIGFKGERGYSAYEIAVQNGYDGTEEQWLQEIISSLYDNLELISNKKTIIDEYSNNVDYPSAKAVSDKITLEINSLSQQINTLLGAKQNNILFGTEAPSPELGANGDIYLQYS